MATIKDIAKMAGVSMTTVSRALNGHSDVSLNTRRKIEQIAKQLNYAPNAAARSLATSKSRTVGVFFSGIIERSAEKDNFAIQILCGINDFANSVNYDILFFNLSSETQRRKTIYEFSKERNLNGVLVWGLKTDDPYYMEIINKKSDYPYVSIIDMPIQGHTVGSVTSDNVGGARAATEHLIELGHREIAMINGWDTAAVSNARLKGFRTTLEVAGLPFIESRVVSGQFTEDGGDAAMRRLLREHPEISAVFCASDIMAYGAMRALERTGRRIPHAMSIVGFDNLAISAYYSPPLTSVHQDKYRLGYKAAELLYSIMEGRDEPRNIVLETELIVRESTMAFHATE